MYAARALHVLPEMADPAFRERMATALDGNGERAPASVGAAGDDAHLDAAPPLSAPFAWASRELLRRDAEAKLNGRGSVAVVMEFSPAQQTARRGPEETA